MQIIRPAAITDANLTVSNVTETAPAAYAGGTTYAIGDTVSTTAGTVVTVWESLLGSNTGNNPAVSPTYWQAVSTTYSEYSSATTYALADRVIDATNHLVYESAIAANVGNALTDATRWTEVSATNRWAMFDAVNSTRTSRLDEIDVTAAFTGKANGLGLMNVTGATAQIIMTTVADGEIYNVTHSLVSDSGISDWYSYFTEEIERVSDFVIATLPSNSAPTIRVIVSEAGQTVSVGTMVVGNVREIGDVVYGARTGIQDYSRVEENTFGEWTLIQRNYAKRASFKVVTDTSRADYIAQILASYRATPIIWLGVDGYASTYIYGFYKDFAHEFAFLGKSYFTFELQGLT